MRKFITSALYWLCFQVMAQTDSLQLYRYHSIFGEFGLNYDINQIKENQFEFQTYSYDLGVSIGVSESYHLNLEWNIGLTMMDQYALQGEVGNFINYPNLKESEPYRYWGGYTGPSIFLGRYHQLELSTFFGVGRYTRNNPFVKRMDAECRFRLGYRYITPKRLIFHPNISVNLGRLGFNEPLYSAKLRIAYFISKPTSKVFPSAHLTQKFPHQIHLSAFAYCFNFNGDFIGGGLSVDHFYFNRKGVQLGYGVAGRYGWQYEGGTLFSTQGYLIGLIGTSPLKIEVATGINIPFNDYSGFGSDIEQYHIGLGLRAVPEDDPIIVRVGVSTTGFIYSSVGINIRTKKE